MGQVLLSPVLADENEALIIRIEIQVLQKPF